MKNARKLLALLLTVAMILSLGVTAVAASNDGASITLNNATIGKFYHAYKLFDAVTDSSGEAVSYVATEEQMEALTEYSNNVFDFTPFYDSNGNISGYQVTLKDGVTDDECTAFIKSFYVEYTSSYSKFTFPGATEVDATSGVDSETGAASASTIVWESLAYGYYFVSSSLGSKVIIDTAAPDAVIDEKNSGDTEWDNEEWNPSEPKKNVLDETGRDINEEEVNIEDTLTYTIAYTNDSVGKLYDEDGNVTDDLYQTISKLTIVDAAPRYTTYVPDSVAITVYDASGEEVENGTAVGTDEDGNNVTLTTKVSGPDANGNITWTVSNLPYGYTAIAEFQVTVNKNTEGLTIVNDATVTVDDHDPKPTNKVENNVPGESDEGNPGKVILVTDENGDVTETHENSINFGEIVTFQLSIDAVNTVKGETSGGNVQVTAYYIYDKLDPGFTLNEQSFAMSFKVNGTETYTVSSWTKGVEKNSSSGVTEYTGKVTDSDGNEKGSVTIYVSQVDEDNDDEIDYTLIMATIDWVDDDGKAYYPDCKVYLTYDATLNENAKIAEDGNVNTAIYDYATTADENPTKPDPSSPSYPNGEDLNHASDQITTVTYTYALGIQKYDGETGKPLAGATFTLKDSDDNTIYGVAVKDDNENILYYNYTSSSTEGATSQFVTNSDGQILIKGVEQDTYAFTETAAPSGYTLVTDPIKVEANLASSTTTTQSYTITTKRYFMSLQGTDENGNYYYTKYSDETWYVKNGTTEAFEVYTGSHELLPTDGTNVYVLVSEDTTSADSGGITVTTQFDVSTAAIFVENVVGSSLPTTGGMGTTMFYIFGALLVFAAGILLVVKRRMRAE